MTKKHSLFGAVAQKLSRAAPFFLPYLMLISGLFLFVSPLPLFILSIKQPLAWSALALMTNALLIRWTGGSPEQVAVAVFLWSLVGIGLPVLLKRKQSLPNAIALCAAVGATLITAVLLVLAHQSGQELVPFLRAEIEAAVRMLMNAPQGPVKELVETAGFSEVVKKVMTEIPSGVVMGLILALWFNAYMGSQFLRGLIAPEFWTQFRIPEALIYPTLLSVAGFLFLEHLPYTLSLNAMKILFLVYGLQGLSVFIAGLNRFKVFGLLRLLLTFFTVFIAPPLLIAVGVFDTWFDFRSKFVQS